MVDGEGAFLEERDNFLWEQGFSDPTTPTVKDFCARSLMEVQVFALSYVEKEQEEKADWKGGGISSVNVHMVGTRQGDE